MAVVTSDFLAGILTNFRALFQNDFQAAMALQGWRDLAVFMPSNLESNTYTWFGTVPVMEDVTHGRAARESLPRYSFVITNNEYQSIIEVERAALERDQLNLIRPRITQMGQEAARHPGQLILQLPLSPGNAFDGVAFFSDTRVIGSSANIDNIATGTGTTVAQIQTDLATVRGTMRKFQDDRGRPMNLIGNVIMCPTELEQAFWQALNVSQGQLTNPTLPASQNGVWSAGGYLVIPNPYLTDANDWYLLHNGGPTQRPFVWQEEKSPELLGGTNPNEQIVIETRKFLYSVNYRGNVGVTDPRFAIKVTNT